MEIRIILGGAGIGVARILSGGCTFLAKKVDDLFVVVALKDSLNIYPKI